MKTFGQRIFASKLYPRLPQAIFLVIFVYILFALLSGSGDAKDNFGSVMVWILWWPVIPLTFILLGRIWCAFCPWGAITDWVQSHICFDKPVPKWIKRYGIWIIFGGFMVITWYELAFGITTSGKATAFVLLFILALAIITSLFFERRVWCRYLCPLGGIFGNYAQTALVEFRGTPEKCQTCTRADCYNGSSQAPGCALYEYPKKMDSNRLCNLCGDCVKSCLKDSPRLKVRLPGKELWEKTGGKLDESVLASVLVGVILISGFGMLNFWNSWLVILELSTGLSKVPLVTIAFFLFAGIALAISLAASSISSIFSNESAWNNLKRFGYALIPLNLATHIGHNLFHFLGEGGNIGKVMAQLFTPAEADTGAHAAQGGSHAAGGHGGGEMTTALMSTETIQILQFALMGVGLAASVLVAWKIAARMKKEDPQSPIWGIFIPHLGQIAIFTAISLLMFVLPMAMRH